MNRELITENIVHIFEECQGNIISSSDAICPEVAGVQMFETPLIGIASSDDILFDKYKEKSVIGPWHMSPDEWLDGAKTVISIFLPFTEAVKKNSRSCKHGPSPAWLHGRVEGQEFIDAYTAALCEWLTSQGIRNCAPSIDARFKQVAAGKGMQEYECVNEKTYGSNWSERHAAYACGLGTFGLSKGIITEKGMAGRFTSIIIDKEIKPDTRPYSDVYEYCTKCGACIVRCPADAISMEQGKNHNICDAWLKEMKAAHAPRYGCGVCQTAVPCESRIPKRK